MQLYSSLFILKLFFYLSISIQALPKLTIDEYLNTTYYSSTSLSPNGEHLLIHSVSPAWESNRYDNTLYLYKTRGGEKKLITRQLSGAVKPQWSPNGNWFFYIMNDNIDIESKREQQYHSHNSNKNLTKTVNYIYLYNIISEEVLWIDIGIENPLAVTWGNDDSCLYFVSILPSERDNKSYEAEWRDVIRYRHKQLTNGSVIYRINIKRKKRKISVKLIHIRNIDFLISEILFVPLYNKLVFTSASSIIENPDVSEVYSIDLDNVSVLSRLTNNEALDQDLQLSTDGKHVFFQVLPLSPNNGKHQNTQRRLYSIDIKNGKMERWGNDFNGNIIGYAIRPQGGAYILGQIGINVHLYIQTSSLKHLILQDGWGGTYRWISSSSSIESTSIAFVYSSFERPLEVYFVDHVNQLPTAKPITNENQLLTQRDLPRAKLFKWVNDEDDCTIEGILHYPPGKFDAKNLPLFVLIHGGPTDASLNMLQPDWYTWAPLAATEGWLVLEPNYRGSTGYGDQFLNEIRSQLLSRPGRDILAGVDRLIADGIVDANRLAVGGYSYGGYLTNWLITQTTRFNVGVSSGGPTEHVSFWGRIDIPVYIDALIGGYPWEIPQIYYNESIIYKLDKVQTPLHIVHGASDVRVPLDQSLMLERALHYLGVPVKLLILPNEDHSIGNNPWHGKIKIREELKWLEKYGHTKSFSLQK